MKKLTEKEKMLYKIHKRLKDLTVEEVEELCLKHKIKKEWKKNGVKF